MDPRRDTYAPKLSALNRLIYLLQTDGPDANKVRAALQAYRTAPGRAPPRTFHIREYMTVKEVLDEATFVAHKKAFARFPKKRNLVNRSGPLAEWVTGSWMQTQNARRSGTSPIPTVARIDQGLQTFMRRHALRAPDTPVGASRMPLHRIISLTRAQYDSMFSSRELRDNGYQAFSRNLQWLQDEWGPGLVKQFSGERGRQIVLLRLRLTDVQEGTPWVWYPGLGEPGERRNWLARGWAPLQIPRQDETLLPPGTLRVLGVEREGKMAVVDVAFSPAPDFIRRGQPNTRSLAPQRQPTPQRQPNARPPQSPPLRDGKGRLIQRGPRGGLYVVNEAGKKIPYRVRR